MSQILEKAFDATQRIFRTIFKGSPNLFTTADVNRQIEALKYQMDYTEERTGVTISGYTFSAVSNVLGNSRLTVSATIAKTNSSSYLIAKGCEFSPAGATISYQYPPLVFDEARLYLCLVAQEKEVAFEDADGDNPNHEISGARFGTLSSYTSRAAANQMIYKNASFVLLPNYQVPPANNTVVAVLARIDVVMGTGQDYPLAVHVNKATSIDVISTDERFRIAETGLKHRMTYDMIVENIPSSSDGFCNLTKLSLTGVTSYPKSILVKAGTYRRTSEAVIVDFSAILTQGIYVEFEPGVIIEDASSHIEGSQRRIIDGGTEITDASQLYYLASSCTIVGNGCRIKNTGSTEITGVRFLINASGFILESNVGMGGGKNLKDCSGTFSLCLNLQSCSGTFLLCFDLRGCAGKYSLCNSCLQCMADYNYQESGAADTFSTCNFCSQCLGKFRSCNTLIGCTGLFTECKMKSTDTEYISPTNNPGWNNILTYNISPL